MLNNIFAIFWKTVFQPPYFLLGLEICPKENRAQNVCCIVPEEDFLAYNLLVQKKRKYSWIHTLPKLEVKPALKRRVAHSNLNCVIALMLVTWSFLNPHIFCTHQAPTVCLWIPGSRECWDTHNPQWLLAQHIKALNSFFKTKPNLS